MAQTKTKSNRSKSGGGSRPSNGSKASGGSKSKVAQASKSAKTRNGSDVTDAGGVSTAREAAKSAGKGVGRATSRAKVPLVAGGAALIGAAGGAALTASKSGRKVMGVRMPQGKRVKVRSKDLRKAAKQVDSFGERVGELTAELQRIRKGISKA